jgi:hypothetical protein
MWKDWCRNSYTPNWWETAPGRLPLGRARRVGLKLESGHLASEARVVPPVRLLHSIPGRIRVHLLNWGGLECEALERRIRLLPGVRGVVANQLTGNVLIRFDPLRTSAQAVMALMNSALGKPVSQAAQARGRSRKLRAPGGKVFAAGPFLVRSVSRHAPAIASLVFSVVTCTTPLGLVRVALETLQLCGELTGPVSEPAVGS